MNREKVLKLVSLVKSIEELEAKIRQLRKLTLIGIVNTYDDDDLLYLSPEDSSVLVTTLINRLTHQKETLEDTLENS